MEAGGHLLGAAAALPLGGGERGTRSGHDARCDGRPRAGRTALRRSFFGAALVAALAGCAETIPPEAEAPQGAAAPTLEEMEIAAPPPPVDPPTRAGGSRTARNRRRPGSRGAVAGRFRAARRHRAGIVQRCAARLVRPRRDADGAVAERHRRNAGRGGSGPPRRARGGRRYRARPAVRRVGARGRAHRPRGGRAGGGVHQRPPRCRRRSLHAGSRPRAASGASRWTMRVRSAMRVSARWRPTTPMETQRSKRWSARRVRIFASVGEIARFPPRAAASPPSPLSKASQRRARARAPVSDSPARRRVGDALAVLAPALLPYYNLDPEAVRYLGNRVVEGPGQSSANRSACERLVRRARGQGFSRFRRALPPGVRSGIRRASPPWATTPRRSSPRWQGGATARRAFRPARLTSPDGFSGAEGLFRFRPDGAAERASRSARVARTGFESRSPRPGEFRNSGVLNRRPNRAAVKPGAARQLRTEKPPSTGIAAPVMKSDAGAARKTATPARIVGETPQRPRECARAPDSCSPEPRGGRGA